MQYHPSLSMFFILSAGFVLGCSGAAPPPPPVDVHDVHDVKHEAKVDPPPVEEKKCTKTCQDQFTIKMRAKPFDPKQWSIELVIDGKKASCTFEWAETSTTADCNGGITMAFQNPPIEDNVTILVKVPGTPSSIDFTVLHQGKPVESARTYTPTYEPIQSNDPACPSSCQQASGRFLLK